MDRHAREIQLSAHNSGHKRRPIRLQPEPQVEARSEVDMLKEARRRNELQRLDEDISRQPSELRGIFNRLRSLIS